MSTIEYVKFCEIQPTDFIILLNKKKIREHLITHDLFDDDSIKAWIKFKIEVDSADGCRVRAIIFNNRLRKKSVL